MDTTTARAHAARLADLLRREQGAMADFLLALADFDRRRLWEALGHSSLRYYLHRGLGLSKAGASHRTEAARLLQRFPSLEAPLRDGRLCLSSVIELGRVLTAENEAEVLPRFFHQSAREAKEIVAALAPRTEVPARVVVTSAAPRPREVVQTPEPAPAAAPVPAPVPAPVAAPPPAATAVEPLTADLRRLHMTVSRRFLDKLAAARDALSHAQPGADAEAILEAGLDLILARQAKRRAQVSKPRRAGPAPGTDPGHVPAEIRRAVWTRDGGRCQWPLDGGGICGSTRKVELDHLLPRARGGPSTVENLRVLCRPHNDLAARLAFGEALMSRFRRAPLGQDESTTCG